MARRFSVTAVSAAVMMLCGTQAYWDQGASAAGYTLAVRTPDEIRAFYAANPWTYDAPVFETEPVLTAPYAAGKLSAETLESAVNYLNLCRYAAGLPADVTISESACEKIQAGALVDCVNDTLSHTPAQPADMDASLFQLGYDGTSSSNLWKGAHDLPQSIAVYLCDMGESNMRIMGHRRWVLNPAMQQTGFGYAGGYTGMYALDRSRTDSFTGDYVAWPCQNMPYELYNGFSYGKHGYTFSVTLGSRYDTPSADSVQVDMTSKKTGKTLHFDKNTASAGNGLYFNVDTQYYGIPNCIIFDPGKDLFDEDDTLSVVITGITEEGAAAEIAYDVSFFRLIEEKPVPGDINGDKKLNDNDLVQLEYWLLGEQVNVTKTWEGADLDGDGLLTAKDKTLMKRLMLKEKI
ncbi:MAG: hypothetical protein IK130_04075 [Oscillospiraceae bacterium]|nr:hypothetical protein [Oscillospiraceae bacterium]